ncbi:phage major capsid protein [Halobacillus salinarum]|uniref:Phage major capsid protein n=1 Tax=Halobacillus salinarum TaxID=2932257 RepID=A0ABY4EFV9_9BACI|nr:phage major capsid protein [Halobacillus salinarum]UOQ43358.1 phage major capsid protein [Halobacillus salinarum]
MDTNQDMLAKVQNAMKAMQRSDLGSSILAREKRQRFVRTVSASTKLLDRARRINMQSHTHDIDRVGFAARILRAATEADEPNGESSPNTDTNTLESVEAIAIAGLTDSTLEDNIEEEDFENTLIDLIADRAGLDLEELFIQGDKSSSDPFLALTDGWLKKAANEVDGTSDADFASDDVESMFDSMIHAVPKKYLRNREDWKFYAHWDIEDAYRNVLRNRGTGLGDSAQTTAQGLAYKGIGVEDSSNMPAGTVLLAPSSNLVYGMYRDIRIEPDRQAKKRLTDFVTTMRVDCHYEDENAAVVGRGFSG